MSENTDITYYKRNRDVILNKAKDYYKNNKERLRKQAKQKQKNINLSEEKNKKREYGKNRHHMSEEKKQRLKRISKKLLRGKKSLNISSFFCCNLRHTTNTVMNKIVF